VLSAPEKKEKERVARICITRAVLSTGLFLDL